MPTSSSRNSPIGYETLIGRHGQCLKPGERFRLALARALLRDPSILIIEEPSGPVDEDTLALLDDTLERASHGRMIIFLASRLSTFATWIVCFCFTMGTWKRPALTATCGSKTNTIAASRWSRMRPPRRSV